MNIQATTPVVADLAMVKGRQQRAWSSGDYAVVGVTLQIVGEMLCEAVDLRSNQRVLDVAAGNGNATLAAARRFAEVVSTDYVGALLERGRERAQADHLSVIFREADAEALPFDDASFDVVLSTFGVMFTPNQQQAADEMMRVCRPGGKVGLANWTPESFVGQLFKISTSTTAACRAVAGTVSAGRTSTACSVRGQRSGPDQKFQVFRYDRGALARDLPQYYGPVVRRAVS
jgi:SAM-dependent methyltransferase